MIVVDTNVIAYSVVPGALTGGARAVLQRDPVWAAPPLWRSELRNVLAGYIRRGDMTVTDAGTRLAGAHRLVTGGEPEPDSTRVLELVAISRCSAYDCEFIAVAEELGTWVVTMDRLMLADFPTVAISPQEFARGA